MAQLGRICLPMQEIQETWVPSLGGKDPLEEEMAAHSSILAWKLTELDKTEQARNDFLDSLPAGSLPSFFLIPLYSPLFFFFFVLFVCLFAFEQPYLEHEASYEFQI